MASYQEQEVRLRVLEDKIEFVMKSFQVASPLSPFAQPKSLLQVYYEVKAGVPLNTAVNGDIIEGETTPEPEVAPVAASEATPVSESV